MHAELAADELPLARVEWARWAVGLAAHHHIRLIARDIAEFARRLRVETRNRSSHQFVQQRLGIFEVRRVETFGEPAVDRRQKVSGLFATTLFAPDPNDTHRS